MKRERFDVAPDGTVWHRYILTSSENLRLAVLDYGATIQQLEVPDRNNQFQDIVPGFSDAKGYIAHIAHFGGVIGRACGRVLHGDLALGSNRYRLSRNSNGHHQHGGVVGFDRRMWEAERDGDALMLKLHSPDGEEGYPGDLDVWVRYRWADGRMLAIETGAVCSQDTLFSPTTHAYFNLAGHGAGTLAGHWLRIRSTHWAELDESALTTGRILETNSENDFSAWRALDAVMAGTCVKSCTYVSEHREVAELWHPETGRSLSVGCTHPFLHYYSGYRVRNQTGKDGAEYGPYCGVCLEPQIPSDGFRHATMPSPILKAHQPYDQRMEFRFSIREKA